MLNQETLAIAIISQAIKDLKKSKKTLNNKKASDEAKFCAKIMKEDCESFFKEEFYFYAPVLPPVVTGEGILSSL